MQQSLKKLPKFSAINIADFPAKLEQRLNANRDKIAHLLNQTTEYSWENLMQPLEDMDDEINCLWSPISHMHAVVSSDAIRQTYQACLPLLTDYTTELGQNKKLYDAIQGLADSSAFAQLDEAQQQIIRNDLRDFRLAGVALPAQAKTRFKAIKKRLSELSNQFAEHVLDASNAWTKHITDTKLLANLPAPALASMQQAAQDKGLPGYLLTLEFPCYHAVITYADPAELRQEIYTAYTTRASDQGPHAGQWDNSAIMDEIVSLRHELAQLSGFAHYTQYSLATKMVKEPQQVQDFIADLAKRAKPQAEQELQQLAQFVRDKYGVTSLNAWDIAYYSEKLRKQAYDISQEELRPYFPQQHVLQGMFTIVNKLYGITLQQREDVDTWHKDVQFFDIYDHDGHLCGQLYMDLYARPNKRDGAWMDECIVRRRLADGSLQHPVAYLTCNFTAPGQDKPALFAHDEVLTLFHEFGHCLHHLLTRVDHAGVSGINGVPWDAVELPSQFLENWCWQKQALALISAHYQTQEPLPEALLDKLLAARHFQTAMKTVRQLEFSWFDWQIHNQYDPQQGPQIQITLDQIRQQIAVVPIPENNRFQHSFSHIFAGGYAAGYYSYHWAEVLASDAFSKFEEKGIFDPRTGQEFLHHILEKGGTKEPLVLFIAFRGREPAIEAFLQHKGIN